MKLSDLSQKLKGLTLEKIRGRTQIIITRDPNAKREKIDEFRAGELPNGSRIGQYANEGYRKFKLQKNPLASGFVDLILTGDYTNGLFAERVEGDRYRFNSTDEKAEKLRQKYGNEIRGLNAETFRDIEETVYKDKIIIWLNNELL